LYVGGVLCFFVLNVYVMILGYRSVHYLKKKKIK